MAVVISSSKHHYKYTKLGEVLPSEKMINIYGVARFMATSSKKLKMVLLDEAEAPIYCDISTSNDNQFHSFGTVPLCTDMILRIHRCRVRVKSSNQQKVIYGQIGIAGLHITAWLVDDDDHTVRFSTSKNCTVQKFDQNRIDELRNFWKARQHNDDLGRLIFFQNVMSEMESPAVNGNNQEGAREELIPEQSQRNNAQAQSSNSRMEHSFDQFAGGSPSPSGEEEEQENRPPMSPGVDLDFMDRLRKKLQRLKKCDTKQFAELTFQQRDRGQFFATNCQILSILVPHDQSPDKPVFLRVCDGTMVSSGTHGLVITEEGHQTQSDLFHGQVDYSAIRSQFGEFVHLISCFDEFKQKAMSFKAGDIVEVRNAHAKISEDYGGTNHLFSVRGLMGRMNTYNRGISLLEEAEENEDEGIGENKNRKRQSSTEHKDGEEEGEGGEEPPRRSTKKEMGNE